MLRPWVAVNRHLSLLFTVHSLLFTGPAIQTHALTVIEARDADAALHEVEATCKPCGPGTFQRTPCTRSTAPALSGGEGGAACAPCSRCPPGHYVRGPCTPQQDTQCSPCPLGTFAPGWNHSRCRGCSLCVPNQEVTKRCSATHDRQCGGCRRGFYRDPDQVLCRKCSYCPPEIDVSYIRVEACRLQGLDPSYQCVSGIVLSPRLLPAAEETTHHEATTNIIPTKEPSIVFDEELSDIKYVYILTAVGTALFLACTVLFILIIRRRHFIDSEPEVQPHYIWRIKGAIPRQSSRDFRTPSINSLHFSNEKVAERLARNVQPVERCPSPARDLCTSDSCRKPCDPSSGLTSLQQEQEQEQQQEQQQQGGAKPSSSTSTARVMAHAHSSSELSRSRSLKSPRCFHRDPEAAVSTSDVKDDEEEGRQLLPGKAQASETAVSYDNVAEFGNLRPFQGGSSSSPMLQAEECTSNGKKGEKGKCVWINCQVQGLIGGKGSATTFLQQAYSKTGTLYL